MQSRSALAVLLAVVFGAVLLTTTRWVQPPGPEAQAETTAPARRSDQPASADYCESKRTPYPLRPLCMELFLPGDVTPQEPSWRQQRWLRDARAKSSVMLALVSDPEQTGDTLSFDRAIESIQSAAESVGYSMLRYWIPWRSAPPRQENPEEAAEARRMLDEPGLLLFRANGDFLAVFLVGESPVSGVRRMQFLNALLYMDALASDLSIVRIVGPNFSGSFPSLGQAIQSGIASYGLGRIRQFRMISPSATVESAQTTFQDRWDCRQAPSGRPCIYYDSIVHNDTYADKHLRHYLEQRWGLRQQDQAVLSESSTEFGSSLRGTAEKRLQVSFPRGISRLRNAYPEATARNLFTPSGGAAVPVQEERLAVPLRGQGSGADRVPGFAKQQMPVTQEAMLLQIASTLRQQDIRVAQIGSTDVFDSIFVAGFLAKAYPEVRIYFADADWLVPRAAERLPLVGSMAVTTFPLFADNQFWSSTGVRALQPMSSRSEIGFLNAFRALALEWKSPILLPDLPLVEYFFEGRSLARPPLWLTAVGTNGYWPVALLDGNEELGDRLQLNWHGGRWDNNGGPRLKVAAPGRIWLTVFFVLAGAALLLALAVMLAQSDALCRRFGALLATWAARPGHEVDCGRAYFTMAECLLAGLMLFVIATPAWNLAPYGPWEFSAASWTAKVVLAVLLAAAAAPWTRLIAGAAARARGYLWLALLVCLGVAGFLAGWIFLMPWRDDPALQAFFFSYRSLDLANGVNPVLPLLLLGAGLLAITFLHHRRHAMFLQMPVLPPELGPQPPLSGIVPALQEAEEPLGHPLVSGRPLGWLLAITGGLTIALLPFERQQSLEGGYYDLLYLAMLALFWGLVALTWARIILVWLRLRPALDRLAPHPLRQAIAALPPGYSGSPILQGAGHYSVTEWLEASRRALEAFQGGSPDGFPREALRGSLEIIEEESRKLSQPHGLAPQRLARQRKAEKQFVLMGTEIVNWLQPHWKPGGAAAEPVETEAVRAGTEFIALQYAAFLSRMMLQFRGLLVYCTVGFVLAMASTMVYPFRSHEELVWAGTLTFLLLGLPVAIVVVRLEHHPVVAALTRRGESGHMPGTLLRLALYAAGPLVAIITPHFPALGRFLVSLLQPAMQALK